MPADAPDPWRASAALLRERAQFVVVGGFAVIANEHIRATQDIDFLVPDDHANQRRCLSGLERLDARTLGEGRPPTLDELGRSHLRVETSAGIVDLICEGLPPLDFESVASGAHRVETPEGQVLVAGLPALVAMKRLAGRPQDLADLDALRRIHGSLPILPVPGLDDDAG